MKLWISSWICHSQPYPLPLQASPGLTCPFPNSHPDPVVLPLENCVLMPQGGGQIKSISLALLSSLKHWWIRERLCDFYFPQNPLSRKESRLSCLFFEAEFRTWVWCSHGESAFLYQRKQEKKSKYCQPFNHILKYSVFAQRQMQIWQMQHWNKFSEALKWPGERTLMSPWDKKHLPTSIYLEKFCYNSVLTDDEGVSFTMMTNNLLKAIPPPPKRGKMLLQIIWWGVG